ncbi:ATP-binding protein [Skermanella pratensis]|uniref:ATP-binding protein n=1 Tax=Skermanella pratensis TaxID=2233999 RepID=UPI001300E71A|nr:ATP-binding protein [Skermanella pratensis]
MTTLLDQPDILKTSAGATLRELVNQIACPIFVIDVEDGDGSGGGFRIAMLNDWYERAFGLTNADCAGRLVEEVLAPCLAYRIAGHYRHCVATRGPIGYEEEIRLGDRVFWTRTMLNPLFHDGRVVRLVGTSTDLTDHRRLEQALEAAQRMARLGWWRMDLATGSTVWSDILYGIHDRDPGSGPPGPGEFLDLVHPLDRDLAAPSARSGSFDYRIVLPDGEIRHLHEERVVHSSGDGHPLALFGTVQDVTAGKRASLELMAAKEQAERASQAKTSLLANMSHELRTPLNAIIGFSEMMAEEMHGPLGDPTYVEYASDVLFAGRHLLDIINDLLDMAKIEAGQVTLNEETVSAKRLLGDVERLLRERASKARLKLTVAPAPDDVAVVADRRLLRQVLLNLVGNAVKFTDAGGEVTLAVHVLADGQICFTTSDTGIGISARDLPVALSPFGRVGSHLQANTEGTGLGLPVAKALIELHGGMLHLNTSPGVGTTAFMTLPSWRVRTPDGRPPAPTIGGLKEFFRIGDQGVFELVEDTGRDALADLPIGIVQLDRTGMVLSYNAAEENFAGRKADLVIGCDFFRDVAPCTFTPEFHGRFRDGVETGNLNIIFSYVFTFDQPMKVLIEMRSGRQPDTAWLFIRWI